MSSYSDDEEPELKSSDEEEEEDDEEEYQKQSNSVLSSFGTKAKHVIGNMNNDDDEEDDEDDEEVTRKKSTRKTRITSADDDDEDYEPEDSEIDDDDDDDDDDVSDEDVEEEEDHDNEEDDTTDTLDEDTEKYTHRFEKETTKDYIMQIHPESIPVSESEIRSMLNVIRNENGIIVDDFHKTLPFITKYEKTRIIGQRAAQLNSGAKPYIKFTETQGIIDSSVIAEMEFNAKKIPAIIKRPLPNGAFEYWRLKDLEILY